MKNKYRIGKSFIAITNQKDVQQRIVDAVSAKLNTYICVSNVRTVLYANKHPDYEEVMKKSYMNIPDGMPLIWAARLWGIKNAQRTIGPELFDTMLCDPQNGIRHFLLGDTNEILQSIANKYKAEKQSLIAGVFSPPFCKLDEYDYSQYAQLINRSNANIVWISMTAPKQDFFAIRLLPYLENKIVIGVGAAFRISLSNKKSVPKIVQQLGLTGFYIRKFNSELFISYFNLLTGYLPLLFAVVWNRLKRKFYL